MLLKTKLLLSLGTLGVAGGTSAGVYLLKNKEEEDKTGKEKTPPSSEKPEGQIQQPSSALNTGEGSLSTTPPSTVPSGSVPSQT